MIKYVRANFPDHERGEKWSEVTLPCIQKLYRALRGNFDTLKANGVFDLQKVSQKWEVSDRPLVNL
jgi:hypothetical protein